MRTAEKKGEEKMKKVQIATIIGVNKARYTITCSPDQKNSELLKDAQILYDVPMVHVKTRENIIQ